MGILGGFFEKEIGGDLIAFEELFGLGAGDIFRVEELIVGGFVGEFLEGGAENLVIFPGFIIDDSEVNNIERFTASDIGKGEEKEGCEDERKGESPEDEGVVTKDDF